MTTWRQANTNAALMAARTQVELGIDVEQPIDVFGAVQALGLILSFAPLGPVSGIYLPGGRSRGILLHEGHPRTRQRYTAAHELGHHVFDHAAEVDFDLEAGLTRGDSEKWPAHEKEAEAFAAWFLMGQQTMRSGLAHLGIDRPRDPYDVYALSLWLGTSYTATARQLAITETVEPSLAQRWTRIPPRDLKLALAGDLAPDDLRNDVWWLDADHNMQPVTARPGDRIVLTLEEIPSSGYTWLFDSLPGQMHVRADSYSDDWEPNLVGEQRREDDTPEDFAGNGSNRSFVIEIDSAADESIYHLALSKRQPWDPTSDFEHFELLISVKPRLHGIQLPESQLALEPGGHSTT